MREIETTAEMKAFLASGEAFNYIAVQSVNLTGFTAELMARDVQKSVFLGCELDMNVVMKLIAGGNCVFPDIKGVPYQPYRGSLYCKDTIFDGFDPDRPETYKQTTDYRVYRHWDETGKYHPESILETLARRLHDHAITNALNALIAPWRKTYRIVAIMGGHSLHRSNEDYRKVALMAKQLSEKGRLMVSGGGPGAMEATHLGVCFANRPESELDEAIAMLAKADHYKDDQWLSQAFRVIERFSLLQDDTRPISVGIPTWLYGHEPPTPFASHIAKYFANSVREEGLLAMASGGVIFSPGGPGTIQEIFQEACQNHYNSFGNISPMIFLNRDYWGREKPVYPLLEHLAKDREYGKLLGISDDVQEIVGQILTFQAD